MPGKLTNSSDTWRRLGCPTPLDRVSGTEMRVTSPGTLSPNTNAWRDEDTQTPTQLETTISNLEYQSTTLTSSKIRMVHKVNRWISIRHWNGIPTCLVLLIGRRQIQSNPVLPDFDLVAGGVRSMYRSARQAGETA